MIEMAIDASTSSCGVAIFECGELQLYFTKKFDGTFSYTKLDEIFNYFEEKIAEFNPERVIVEEPLVYAKQSRSVAMLNLVGGVIFAVGRIYRKPVFMYHGNKVKKILKFKTKQESIKLAQRNYKVKGLTEHEADAINLYTAFILDTEKYEEKPTKADRKNRKAKPASKPKNRSKSARA